MPSSLTLELFNHCPRPLEIDAGMPIAHLRITPMVSVPERSRMSTIYEGIDPLTSPLLYEEWSIRLQDGA